MGCGTSNAATVAAPDVTASAAVVTAPSPAAVKSALASKTRADGRFNANNKIGRNVSFDKGTKGLANAGGDVQVAFAEGTDTSAHRKIVRTQTGLPETLKDIGDEAEDTEILMEQKQSEEVAHIKFAIGTDTTVHKKVRRVQTGIEMDGSIGEDVGDAAGKPTNICHAVEKCDTEEADGETDEVEATVAVDAVDGALAQVLDELTMP